MSNMNKEEMIEARNSVKPIFYKVTVEGKTTTFPFINDACKKYYIKLMKSTVTSLPVKLVAYTIVGNTLTCVVSTFDQFEESIYRYFLSINEEYSSKYYAKVYADMGYLFKNIIKIKRVSKLGDLLNSIVSVNKLSEFRGLGDFRSYPFSSYNNALTTETNVDMSDLYCYVRGLDRNEFVKLHVDREYKHDVIFDYTGLDEKSYFITLLDTYKTKTKKYREEVIIPMFMDYFAETGCSFVSFASKFKMAEEKQRTFHLEIALRLFNQKYDFFGISEILGTNSRELLFQLIDQINEQLGYGLYYILDKLNIAFADDLINDFINYITETSETSPQLLAKRLSFNIN